jgi:hypothetical protein
MSQYLIYVLDRGGIPAPKTIVVCRHPLAWVNPQLTAEFRAVFEKTEVLLLDSVAPAVGDLIVLPYMHEFHEEAPGGLQLYRQLRSAPGAFVMLYGVGYRKIIVMPADAVERHFRRCRRVAAASKYLWTPGISRIARTMVARWGKLESFIRLLA